MPRKRQFTDEERKIRRRISSAASSRRWQERNVEKVRAYRKKYREKHRAWYKEWNEKNRERNCKVDRIRSRRRRNEIKAKLIEEFGGKCAKCGYSRCIRALEFHHREATNKLFNVSGANFAKRTYAKVLEEAKKCDLLCANCHRELHNKH